MAETSLVWLRNDLRIAGNPALAAALGRSGKTVALYVHETDPALRPRGAASLWWLNRSLETLSRDLAEAGVALEVVTGPADVSLLAALTRHSARFIVWNRRYGPSEREIDARIKTELRSAGIDVQSYSGNVLVEPFDIATKSGLPYGVFTPFWRALRSRDIALPLLAAKPAPAIAHAPVTIPPMQEWSNKLARHWQPGEKAARLALETFLDERLATYPETRDIPSINGASRLSPHLAFGEIDVRLVWHAALAIAQREPAKADAVEKYLSELAWRDFNIHQFYHRADIATVPMQSRFAELQWRLSPENLTAWQKGRTGIPIVDAGMRELWETGYMHNRVRMLTASFLAKSLLLDWRLGESWFWDTLVDADPANNPGNWQWVAGTGLDAAPWFRIFNPLVQAQRFDPDQTYVRRWVPEYGTSTYPAPIVDLSASRERALAAFKAV